MIDDEDYEMEDAPETTAVAQTRTASRGPAVHRTRRREARLRNLHVDSLVDDMSQLEAKFRDMHVKAQRARDVLRPPSEYYLQPRWKREAYSGDQMLQSLFDCLAQFDQSDFRRSKEQVEMHLMWTQACLPQIYAHEYASKLPELLLRFGVPSFWSFVAIFATRRFGKTFAMSMFVAAFLWTQQRSVISVFSISQRTSKAMMDKILMMLHKLLPPGQELKIITKNVETLTIVNPMGARSTVYSYPCSEIRDSSLSPSPPTPPHLPLSLSLSLSSWRLAGFWAGTRRLVLEKNDVVYDDDDDVPKK